MKPHDHPPGTTKKVWETKATTEIDMTTTGSPLLSEKLPFYVTRLLRIDPAKNSHFWKLFVKTPDKARISAEGEISAAVQALRKLRGSQKEIIFAQEDQKTKTEYLIKGLVAKLEHYEVTNILDRFVLPILPSSHRDTMVDLASGIGRYLDYFSSAFRQIFQIDFLEKNIRRARELHAAIHNVEYITDDVRTVAFETNSINFVFGNWLLQYLRDDEIPPLLFKLRKWLVPGGIVFFHEGIKTNFEGRRPNTNENPAIFRQSVTKYSDWFESSGFNIVQQGHLSTYGYVFNNPNQIYWILQNTTKG